MAVTPEGKVKKMVNAVLDEFAEPIQIAGLSLAPLRGVPVYSVHTLYRHWPVPSGFGSSTLDCIVAYFGRAIFIETKAPGEHPTPRQDLTIAQIKGAHTLVFVIDGEEGCEQLRSALSLIRLSHANNR